jgi:hypothetical protein
MPTTPPATATPQLKQAVTPVDPTPQGARRIPPDVLLPGISWGGLGGGGVDCPTDLARPEFYITTTGYPGRPDINVNALITGGRAIFEGCGFPPLETATVAFYFPDGRVDSDQIQIDKAGQWEVTWWSLPEEPLGEYIFEFISSTGAYTANFVVFEPPEPEIAFDCSPDQMTILLVGFEPGEEVLLGRYALEANEAGENLLGYEYATIGPDGSAMFSRPREDVLMIAIGRNAQPWEFEEQDGNIVTILSSAHQFLVCAFLE